MTGAGKGEAVIAVAIGLLLGSSGNGSGRVMPSAGDTSHVDLRC
jgi:hypothetical protein